MTGVGITLFSRIALFSVLVWRRVTPLASLARGGARMKVRGTVRAFSDS